MMYFDAGGKLVETTDGLQNEAVLQEKLDKLLAPGQ